MSGETQRRWHPTVSIRMSRAREHAPRHTVTRQHGAAGCSVVAAGLWPWCRSPSWPRQRGGPAPSHHSGIRQSPLTTVVPGPAAPWHQRPDTWRVSLVLLGSRHMLAGAPRDCDLGPATAVAWHTTGSAVPDGALIAQGPAPFPGGARRPSDRRRRALPSPQAGSPRRRRRRRHHHRVVHPC